MKPAFTSSPRSDWMPGTLNLREPRLQNNQSMMRKMKIKGPKAKAMKPVNTSNLVPLSTMAKAPKWRFKG